MEANTLTDRPRRSRICALLLGLGLLSGCVSAITKESIEVAPEIVESTKRYRKEYLLSAGDQIEVHVRRDPEVSRTCLIRPDGYISLPTLQDVKAAGLTVPELNQRLTELLSKRRIEPEVTVIVTSARQPMVYVIGEVGRPGPIPLREVRTAGEAVAMAGGFTRTASGTNVAVIRLTDEGVLRAYKIGPVPDGQPGRYMALQAMLLQADDMILVPEGKRSQFGRFVDDFINKPLSGISSMLIPYFQLRFLEELEDEE